MSAEKFPLHAGGARAGGRIAAAVPACFEVGGQGPKNAQSLVGWRRLTAQANRGSQSRFRPAERCRGGYRSPHSRSIGKGPQAGVDRDGEFEPARGPLSTGRGGAQRIASGEHVARARTSRCSANTDSRGGPEPSAVRRTFIACGPFTCGRMRSAKTRSSYPLR